MPFGPPKGKWICRAVQKTVGCGVCASSGATQGKPQVHQGLNSLSMKAAGSATVKTAVPGKSEGVKHFWGSSG